MSPATIMSGSAAWVLLDADLTQVLLLLLAYAAVTLPL